MRIIIIEIIENYYFLFLDVEKADLRLCEKKLKWTKKISSESEFMTNS
jgi:hypothetical protein